MAMPTSARASAGASLMPSPTIATTRPSACRRAISATLPSGRHARDDAADAHLPGHRLGRRALVAGQQHDVEAARVQPGESPRRASGLIGSATAITPASAPSTPTNIDGSRVARQSRSTSARQRIRGDAASAPSIARCRRDTRRPPTDALTPCPVIEWKPCDAGSVAGRAPARAPTTAPASGCSDSASTAAATAQRARPGRPATRTRPRRRSPTGRPSVTVPVLSSTTVVTSPARCRASPPLTRMPSDARAAAGDHHGRRHGQPHRARARDDQHGDRRGKSAHQRRACRPAPTTRRTSQRPARSRPGRRPR